MGDIILARRVIFQSDWMNTIPGGPKLQDIFGHLSLSIKKAIIVEPRLIGEKCILKQAKAGLSLKE